MISRRLVAQLDARQTTGRDAEQRTIGERFDLEHRQLLPLPEAVFEAGRTQLASVGRRALVRIEGAYYSVPCRWAGLDVTAIVRARSCSSGPST